MDTDDYIPDIDAIVQTVDSKDKRRGIYAPHKNVAHISLEEYGRVDEQMNSRSHQRNSYNEGRFRKHETGSPPSSEVPRRSSLGESSSSSVEELVVPQPSSVSPGGFKWIKQEDASDAPVHRPGFPHYNDLGHAAHRPQRADLLPPSLDEMTKQKTTVTFGNLGSTVSSDDIEELCGRYGEVFNATILKDANDHPSGYAVADFTSRTAAEQCVRGYDNKMLDGLPMKCFIRPQPPSAERVESTPHKLPMQKRLGPTLPPPDRFYANRNTVYHRPEHYKPPRFGGVDKKKSGTASVSKEDLDRELMEYRKRGTEAAIAD